MVRQRWEEDGNDDECRRLSSRRRDLQRRKVDRKRWIGLQGHDLGRKDAKKGPRVNTGQREVGQCTGRITGLDKIR